MNRAVPPPNTSAYDNAGGGGNGKILQSDVGQFDLFLSQSGTIQYDVSPDSASMASANSYAIPVDSEWYHVAVVVDRDNAGGSNPSAIYVNSANLTSNPMEDTPTALAAGNNFDTWGRSLAGQGDDFAIFKEALSAQQIRVITGLQPASTPMMLIGCRTAKLRSAMIQAAFR